ncbi:MAG: Crp/Fnr family transcriptional regulator [Terriglobia bacterium]
MLCEAERSFNFPTFAARIETGKTVLQRQPRQRIFTQGSAADSVYYIQNGRIKLTVVSVGGREAVLGILERDNFFGEGCLAGEAAHTATAAAIENSTIIRFTKEAMLRLVRKEIGFSYFFMSHLLSRHMRMQEDLMDQLTNCSEKRLARTLLLLAQNGKKSKLEPVIPPVSEETLAGMVGTTRSRISFFMNKFKKQGFVEYSDGWKINDSLRTVVLQD